MPSSKDAQYEITRLRILAEGCRKHPAYRARRKPGVDSCPACNEMWLARQELKTLAEAE